MRAVRADFVTKGQQRLQGPNDILQKIGTVVVPILSVVMMAVSMAMLFSSLKAAGITMSANSPPLSALPEGVSAWNGWANRFVFAAYYLWVILAGRAVLAQA